MTTIDTEQIASAEALLLDRLAGLRRTFEDEERHRVTQRDEIRDVALELAGENGSSYEDGVNNILVSMGLERGSLEVTAFVHVKWEQTLPTDDRWRLRVRDRDRETFTDWRPGYSEVGHLAGDVLLSWKTAASYDVDIEDTSIHHGQDCYCDHLASIIPDLTDLSAQHVEPFVPAGSRIVGYEYVGCSGQDCPTRNASL